MGVKYGVLRHFLGRVSRTFGYGDAGLYLSDEQIQDMLDRGEQQADPLPTFTAKVGKPTTIEIDWVHLKGKTE